MNPQTLAPPQPRHDLLDEQKKLLRRYKHFFLNPARDDRYGRKINNDTWLSCDIKPSMRHVQQHLEGRAIIGVSLYDNYAGWICFDIDNHGKTREQRAQQQPKAEQEVAAIVEAIERETGKLPIVEQSIKNGGYHVWLLLMNGRYPEYKRKIKPFAMSIKEQANVDCEVFAPGHKVGNMRLPFSREYTLINPYTFQQTGATGFEAVRLLEQFMASGIYAYRHQIEEPDELPDEEPKLPEYTNVAKRVAELYHRGLPAPGRRIKSLRLLYWYLCDYQGQYYRTVKSQLKQWIQTKHNDQSRDINANYNAGIKDSLDFINTLPEQQNRHRGSSFYYSKVTGVELPDDALLLVRHLHDLLHYCATHLHEYRTVRGCKIGQQYHVTIPYSKQVRKRMYGLTDRKRRRRAEQELKARGLIQEDRQHKLFLQARKGRSAPRHLLINVQLLYGYRTGESVWTQYKDRLSSASVLSQIAALQRDYTQAELARICDTPERTFKRWIGLKKVPEKHLHKLLFLIP